jgi:hypothetical protein
MLEPSGSWVAKWQRIGICISNTSNGIHLRFCIFLGHFEPGLYAIDVVGQLPDDALEQCENHQMEHRAAVKAAK